MGEHQKFNSKVNGLTMNSISFSDLANEYI